MTLIILGISIGIISALFGVGGGFLTVPILLSLFPKAPFQTAVGISLTVIFLNSTMVNYRFFKVGKRIPKLLLIFIILGMIAGTQVGSLGSLSLSKETLKALLGIIILFAGLKTLFINTKQNQDPNLSRAKNYLAGFIITFISGIISALTGLGGGVTLVPLFLFLLKVQLKNVSFFSNICMASGAFIGMLNFIILGKGHEIALPGALGPYQLGFINFGVVFFIFLGGFLGTKLGVHLSPKLGPKLSKMLFASLLFGIALKILILK